MAIYLGISYKNDLICQMDTIKVITIDDNPNDLNHINSILKKIEEINIIKSFTTYDDLLNFLEKESCDIVFTDIELGKKNSIQLIKNLTHKVDVVFISSFPKYAYKSFAVDPLHYIVKPVSHCELLTSIERFTNKNISSSKSCFFVKRLHSAIEKIYFEEILFIEANKDTIKIKTNSEEIETLLSIKKVLEKLPENFIRIHRSFVINSKFVSSFDSSHIKVKDYIIPISRAYKKKVLEFIHQLAI